MACTGVPPRGENNSCTCDGCWDCEGHVPNCTCDVDWECVNGRHTSKCGGLMP